MSKTQQDFEFWVGDDKSIQYAIEDSAGASVDVSGFTCRWVIQDEPDSGSLLVYWTGGSGVVVTGCTATVALAGSDTAGCAWEGTYYTELSACDGSGNDTVLAVGYADVHRRGY